MRWTDKRKTEYVCSGREVWKRRKTYTERAIYSERNRDRHRDRVRDWVAQREKHTERKRDREKRRERQREKERDRDRDRQRQTERAGERYRYIDREPFVYTSLGRFVCLYAFLLAFLCFAFLCFAFCCFCRYTNHGSLHSADGEARDLTWVSSSAEINKTDKILGSYYSPSAATDLSAYRTMRPIQWLVLQSSLFMLCQLHKKHRKTMATSGVSLHYLCCRNWGELSAPAKSSGKDSDKK